MKDWIFYPLMTLIAGAMVFFAVNYGEPPPPINPEEGFVLKGPDLQYLTPPAGTRMRLEGTEYIVLSADFKSDEQPSQGVFATLSSDYVNAYVGREIELIIRARASASDPTDAFKIGLFTVPSTKGRIGWKTYNPGPEFKDYKLITTLSNFAVDDPVMYFGIWPDADGEGRNLDVQRYEVRLVEP